MLPGSTQLLTPQRLTKTLKFFPFFLKLGLTNADNNSIMEEQDRHAVSQAVSPPEGRQSSSKSAFYLVNNPKKIKENT